MDEADPVTEPVEDIEAAAVIRSRDCVDLRAEAPGRTAASALLRLPARRTHVRAHPGAAPVANVACSPTRSRSAAPMSTIRSLPLADPPLARMVVRERPVRARAGDRGERRLARPRPRGAPRRGARRAPPR